MEKHSGVNYKAYIKKNDEFHKTIYTYANSPLLIDLIQRLLARVNPYIYLYAMYQRDLTDAMKCHYDILSAFQMVTVKRQLRHCIAISREQSNGYCHSLS